MKTKLLNKTIEQLTPQEVIELGFKYSPTAQMITSNRFILEYNASFSELFGYDLEELKGQSILLLYPSSHDFEIKGKVWNEALKKHPIHEDERFMRHRDETIFWVHFIGKTLTPDNPFELMSWALTKISHKRKAVLTKREQEIASYIVNGLTSKKIAMNLGLSPRTVETHRGRIMKKLDAKNLDDLRSKYLITKTT